MHKRKNQSITLLVGNLKIFPHKSQLQDLCPFQRSTDCQIKIFVSCKILSLVLLFKKYMLEWIISDILNIIYPNFQINYYYLCFNLFQVARVVMVNLSILNCVIYILCNLLISTPGTSGSAFTTRYFHFLGLMR